MYESILKDSVSMATSILLESLSHNLFFSDYSGGDIEDSENPSTIANLVNDDFQSQLNALGLENRGGVDCVYFENIIIEKYEKEIAKK